MYGLAPAFAVTIGITLLIVSGAVLLAAAGYAGAQEFPAKPVRLVVGFPPGGSNDIVARQLAPKFGEFLGVQVVV